MQSELITVSAIENRIFTIREQKVMIDKDLAELYGVPTSRLNEAVKRNIKRFPSNFMFQLTKEENDILISQIAISKNKSVRGGRRSMPYVFTEQGVAMLSSVLNSERAIQINIQIMNAFVEMRRLAIEHKDLQEQIAELKEYFMRYAKDDNEEIERINQAINMLADRTKPLKIGFRTNKD